MQDLKSTEERQKEIVEAAKVLFFEKGYEQTSTVDIMRAVLFVFGIPGDCGQESKTRDTCSPGHKYIKNNLNFI
mgnify:CR=1 FL=1